MQATASALVGRADEDPAMASQPVVLFNASKKELHHPGAGYKRFYRRLRSNFGCKTQVNKESGQITLARLQEARLVVFGAPSMAFAEAERDAIHAYVQGGGSVLFCTGEGGDGRGGELNDVLRPFGVATADNCVVRAAYYKYHHPKEVFVADGIVNSEIGHAVWKLGEGKGKGVRSGFDARKGWKKLSSVKSVLGAAARAAVSSPGPDGDRTSSARRQSGDTLASAGDGVEFVYPRGASLRVSRLARPLLSSGRVAYPNNHCICAAYDAEDAEAQAEDGPEADGGNGRRRGHSKGRHRCRCPWQRKCCCTGSATHRCGN